MTQMSIPGYERMTTSWRRAAIVGLLYATVTMTLLPTFQEILPNLALGSRTPTTRETYLDR